MILGGALLLLLAIATPIANAATDRAYLPRVLLWREADVGDLERFPARAVRAAPPAYVYQTAPAATTTDPWLAMIGAERHGRQEELSLEEGLAATGTTAFLVIHGDRLVYEGYFNGDDRDSTQTSFSVAKSFVSALVGIAIAEGRIASVEDPVTRYLPELRERDPRFDRVTIRRLLSMSSGLRYQEGGMPWNSDDTRTYYAPDLRKLALEGSRVERDPGERFEYNNYHPLLLGLVLERATGQPVASYLEEKLWRPLGAEADGSWNLDSDASGFEKMESGINGRAIDFAKLGSLYLHGGEWRGRQVVPRAWVEESTRVHAAVGPAAAATGYGYFWWVGEGGHFAARGNHGQLIFVAPDKGLVIVRFGTRFGRDGGNPDWIRTFEEMAARFEAPIVNHATAPVEPTGATPAPDG
ncbi:MAG: beta-lactamase family protein [Chloroflexota bacterium]|nr:beta-lactamase family protein [Chloroflexota bacterium]